ncbi:permease [Candidatus Latescibacterota bacterium]
MTFFYELIDIFYDLYFFVEKLFRGTYTESVISNTLVLFKGLWYYVIFGAFAAVLIAQLMTHEKIRNLLTRRGNIPILFAAVLGVISPMCTFAAIPLVGGLMAAGVPLPPLMAFLISSPLMNPSLFVITWGVLGPQMALVRTFSALLLGIIGGVIVEFTLVRKWLNLKHVLRPGFTVNENIPLCTRDSQKKTYRLKVLEFLRHSRIMILFISKYFLLALFLAGAVQAFIKPGWIALLLGGQGFTSILLGGLLGVPLYVCGGGTVALIGVFINMGMGQGTALAFFITGPATKISTIISLHAVVRKKVALIYLGVILIGGVLLGYGYSKVASDLTIDPRFYGQVETKEDAVLYKRGIGSPQDL